MAAWKLTSLNYQPLLFLFCGEGWITCDLGLSKVFQLYKDDGRIIMKGCVQWNPLYG